MTHFVSQMIKNVQSDTSVNT